jgi:hypothetical protein
MERDLGVVSKMSQSLAANQDWLHMVLVINLFFEQVEFNCKWLLIGSGL